MNENKSVMDKIFIEEATDALILFDCLENTIHKIGTLITNLARNYKVPVVIVNQVAAYIDQPYESFGRTVVPCFGIALSNYVHTRIFVRRTDKMIKETVSSDNY